MGRTGSPSHDEQDLDCASYEGRESIVLPRLLLEESDPSCSEEHAAPAMLCSSPQPEREPSPNIELGRFRGVPAHAGHGHTISKPLEDSLLESQNAISSEGSTSQPAFRCCRRLQW